jgi:hypothetical protein
MRRMNADMHVTVSDCSFPNNPAKLTTLKVWLKANMARRLAIISSCSKSLFVETDELSNILSAWKEYRNTLSIAGKDSQVTKWNISDSEVKLRYV